MTKRISNFVRPALMAAALLLAAAVAAPALAQAAPITGVPAMKDFPGANELPDPKLDYKIAFDMNDMPASSDKVLPGLMMIGAIINTYESHGVPADHLHLVAVFHGPTIVAVTDDATYKARTGVEHNPNVDLLNQLRKAGLKTVVCGQSTMAQHYDFKSIQYAQINLSATVTFINLMTRGYIKLNE